MFCLLFILIPLLSQNLVYSSTVLLWSNSNLPEIAVPLSKISSLDVVSNHICKIPSNTIQLRLFAVNQLTNEDLQRGSQSQHSLLIDAKNKNGQYRFLPNVDDEIYQTFALIPQSNHLACSHIQFAMYSWNVYETLHDALNAMHATVEKLDGKSVETVVAALITGPVVGRNLPRKRRDTTVVNVDRIRSKDETCLFNASQLLLSKLPDQKDITLNYNESSCDTSDMINNSTVSLKLYWQRASNQSFGMNISVSFVGRYWHLNSVDFNNSRYKYFAYGMHNSMDTPRNYSYACTTAQFVKYNFDTSKQRGSYDFNNKFFIKNFLFQPFGASNNKFGPPNYCTSFFTSGIWMGITSSLLCLGILLVGVYRMMSIKSNDRFDDPRGRPLVIKAQE